MLDRVEVLAQEVLDLQREVVFLEAERSTHGRTAAYARVRRRLGREVRGALRAVQRGEATPQAAGERFARAYERAAIEAATGSAARAEVAPTIATFAAVETEVDKQARLFAGFMADVRNGTDAFSGGPDARAEMYVGRLDGFRNKVWADSEAGEDVLWWWELGGGDSCADCLVLHLESPYPERAPTVPRLSGTRCGSNCTCRLTITTGGRRPGT